jgi:exportin-7
LVDELNIPTAGRTLTQHRKTSVSFRDVSLLKVFQLGLTTLKQLQTGAICKFESNILFLHFMLL